MPIWLIDLFGASRLDQSFWIIAVMTAPVWIAMICLPAAPLVRALAHPLVLPPLYSLAMLWIFCKSYRSWLFPDALSELSYSAAQALARHPVAFLALFCNFQIMNLILGTTLYQKESRCGFRATVELLLCWLFGAPVLIVFALRLLLRRDSLR